MRLIIFILVIFIATFLGVMIHKDPGYALFGYQDWTVEMPLWLAALLLLILVFCSFFLLRIFYFFFSSSSRLKNWWSTRQSNKSRKQLMQGLLELAGGHYKKAEKFLSHSARHSEIPLVHYLSAAQAAERSNAPERRDRYLQLAHDVSGDSDFAVRLTEAELRYHHGDVEQSIALLQHLHAEQPKHPQVLKLLAILYEDKEDWHSLYTLIPELKKASVFPEQTLTKMQLQIYPVLLPEIARKEDLRGLIKFWRSAPPVVQQNPSCIILYVKALLEQDAMHQAEEILKQSLKLQWDSQLIEWYGKIKGPSLHKQLNFVESYLSSQQSDPYLFLTLGRLCIAQQLWGKARDYLETSIHIKPIPEAYALLGTVMEQLGQREKAQEYYKKGLLLLS